VGCSIPRIDAGSATATVRHELGGELHSGEEFRVTQWFDSSATVVDISLETRRSSSHRRTIPSAATMQIRSRRRNSRLPANGAWLAMAGYGDTARPKGRKGFIPTGLMRTVLRKRRPLCWLVLTGRALLGSVVASARDWGRSTGRIWPNWR
jgi:hypothetical protein